jgi:hypothetical protein
MQKDLATPAAGLPLADMNLPQLTQAQAALGEAQERYDRLSGICAVLRGLVLTEIKHKLPHGRFMTWVQEHFGKTHREATRCMRIADDFTSRLASKKTPEGKLDTRVQFEAAQLLLGDLASNLAAIEDSKLDMSHPVVATVATYVDGRSYRQLLFDLGPSYTIGGDTRKIDPATGQPVPHARKPALETQAEEFLATARKASLEAAALAHLTFVKDGLHRHLREADLDSVLDAINEAGAALKRWKALPKNERTRELTQELQ